MTHNYNSKFTQFRSGSTLILFLWMSLSISLTAQVGIYTVDGNLTLSSITTTEIQLVDLSGPGTGHDQIATTGDATIDGTLQIILNGYSPSPNDQFEIMDITGAQSGTFSSVSWPAGMSTWSIDYGVLNPGKVTIYGPTSALPVELINFKVEVHMDHNYLHWQTASEINNDYFEVESSRDGDAFQAIQRIVGAGYSTHIHDYSYRHKVSIDGSYYYRIRQVDWDGKYTYSAIRAANRENGEDTWQLYPNPTTGIVYFSAPVTEIELYDTTGKRILRSSSTQDHMDISHLSSGMYYIRINGGTERHAITINK